jgi:hypothetical protein
MRQGLVEQIGDVAVDDTPYLKDPHEVRLGLFRCGSNVKDGSQVPDDGFAELPQFDDRGVRISLPSIAGPHRCLSPIIFLKKIAEPTQDGPIMPALRTNRQPQMHDEFENEFHRLLGRCVAAARRRSAYANGISRQFP